MKYFIISLAVMMIVVEVTGFSSGGLMCLGKAMCSSKSKDSGRKKNVAWRSRPGGLWKGSYGPDDGIINWRPWFKHYEKRNNRFFRTRYLKHCYCAGASYSKMD